MPRAKRAWQALRALSWGDRALVVLAWCMLPMVAVGLRLVGFQRLRAWATSRPGTVPSHDLDAALAMARLVRGAAAWSVPRPRCLTRSLVLVRLLQRRGLTAELRIGVDRTSPSFAAHAWVEHAGVALGEPEGIEARYATFDGPLDTRALRS